MKYRHRLLVVFAGVWLWNAACTGGTDGRPVLAPTGPTATTPTPTPAPPSPPPAPFPSIAVGEVVRFQFNSDDRACAGPIGRCRSYDVKADSNGVMVVAITSTSADTSFLTTLEMYVVPGADDWEVGPGPQVSARLSVIAGATYEIRMYSSVVPSAELELRVTLTPR
jgi:hypothetical protein